MQCILLSVLAKSFWFSLENSLLRANYQRLGIVEYIDFIQSKRHFHTCSFTEIIYKRHISKKLIGLLNISYVSSLSYQISCLKKPQELNKKPFTNFYLIFTVEK